VCVDRPFKYEIFNLGEHHTTSLRELIDLISKHVGKPAVIEQKPLQPGDVEITYADISHARELLGYNPQFSMDEGIRQFVEWYNQQNRF
jgi:UDP-glucuronate 4-epimerase